MERKLTMVKAITIIFSLILLLTPALSLTSEASPATEAEPNTVNVEQNDDGSHTYLVDGRPQFLVGMGYNVIYRNLPDEERAARYDADFSRMHAAGINTIMGWDADKGYEQDKFDQLTLDRALEHDLGVVMPFVLPPDGNYADTALQEQLKADLIAKVETYKDHPALRMWGVGNEVMQDVVANGQAEDFGRFYLELADAVHEVDPNHPVIYREAEDGYLPYLAWYQADGGVDRPWLLYGMNAYTMRLQDILAGWPSLSNGMPLFITEFAPEGWSRADRPDGYLKMWEMIRSHPEYVLGGAPYVWTTDGPEPGDRNFGLVDANGNPMDGSLEALTKEFQKASAATIVLASTGREPRLR
ncbi:MAG: hypothetical protein M1358_13085 [Chloroflexi bacterium]|nr:hypothetical protein [Chloroflexota bacterium]